MTQLSSSAVRELYRGARSELPVPVRVKTFSRGEETLSAISLTMI